MNQYEPEIGQALFGQPHQQFPTNSYIEAALQMLSEELKRVMWNINQEEYPSPFDNTGMKFECETFKVHAYSWGYGLQPWNFKWSDIEISWYKYLGRGMSSNKEIKPAIAAKMLDQCLKAIRKHEEDNMPSM